MNDRTRPYRLSNADGDAAHAVPWDDAAIERFTLRVGTFVLAGFEAEDAEDLAERLHLRDVEADGRRSCFECHHLRALRCGNVLAAGLGMPLVGRVEAARLKRCQGFAA